MNVNFQSMTKETVTLVIITHTVKISPVNSKPMPLSIVSILL